MVARTESAIHQGLVRELANWLEHSKGFRIFGADLPEYESPAIIANNGLGDGERKQPDVIAYDPVEGVFINGEAKTGEGDLTTQHTKTQFLLFSSLQNSQNRKSSWLYVIVPPNQIGPLESVIHELGLGNKPNILLVRSSLFA